MNIKPLAFHILTKPTGSICNLDCKYCYFLSKESLYPGDRFRMKEEVLEAYIRQLIEAHHTPEVNVAWQGGEPTLMGLDFFRHSVELVHKYKKVGQTIQFTIQTNGTKLDDDWAEFFHEHNFLVGLSVDGPRHLHDAYRVDKQGQGSFARVMKGFQYLRKHNVEVNILCTVHAANQHHPLEVYRFFRDEMGVNFVQFIPIVERATKAKLPLANKGWSLNRNQKRPLYVQQGNYVTERSVEAKVFGQFLITIFDEWVQHDVGQVFVQMFDVALANWYGVPPGLCIFAKTCGLALALEHNGDLYSCDHFVEPNYRLGNIMETPMVDLVASPQQRSFGLAKNNSLPKYCQECEVRFACNGGCPRNRFIKTPDGKSGLNYLCAGYKSFFNHIDPAMRLMSQLIQQRRSPAEIMQIDFSKSTNASDH